MRVPAGRTSKVISWNIDLMRLRSGELSFDAFARRHAGIVRRLSSKWGNRCPERFGADDAVQEALLEIWRSVDAWDPAFGIPLHAFVRQRVRFRLLSKTDRQLKGRDVETRYLWTVGRRDDSTPDRSPQLDERVNARRRLATIVGSVDSATAEVVMGIAEGERLGTLRDQVYASCTPSGAVKRARLALRHASEVAAQS